MINPESKANLVSKIVDLFFYAWPSFAILIILEILGRFEIVFPTIQDKSIEATCSATWISLGFAAAVFLIGIPKNKELNRLIQKGIFKHYVRVILLPSILGTIHMLGIIYELKSTWVNTFFLFTVSQSFWSIYILFSIVKKSHSNGKI